MNKAPFLGLILATAMTSGLAYAQTGDGFEGRGYMADRFADMDTNGDGRITRDEMDARISADFANADEDGNGTLSEDEARAFHETRHAEHRAEREARRAELHEERGDRGGRHFERAAGDDGVIDRDEFATRGLHRFEMADLDENGEVTETEMALVGRFMGGRHGRHELHEGPHHGPHHGDRDGRWGDGD